MYIKIAGLAFICGVGIFALLGMAYFFDRWVEAKKLLDEYRIAGKKVSP